MRGIFLGYDKSTDTCLISGDDGNRYTCTKADCLTQFGNPTLNGTVDFEITPDGKAANVVAVSDPSKAPPPLPPPVKRGAGCLIMIAIAAGIAALGVIVSTLTPDKPKDQCAGTDGEIIAYVDAKRFVTERLKAPSTAVFPDISDSGVKIAQTSTCVFLVNSYVDADNAFGAKLRKPYYLKLTVDPVSGRSTLNQIVIDD